MSQKIIRWMFFIATLIIFLKGGIAMSFELKSQSFVDSGTIPTKHTCDGPDLSPLLEWNGVPEGTMTFALIVDDPDAPVGTWVHWVLYNLPGDIRKLPEEVPANETTNQGASQGVNDFRKIGYGGPCPPSGKPHRYFFKLYALDKKVDHHPGQAKKNLLRQWRDT